MKEKKIRNVIIIDDDSLNNFFIEATIDFGFSDVDVQCFVDARSGLDFIDAYYCSTFRNNTILILDINMRELTGWDFLEILRGYPDTIKNQFDLYVFSSSVCVEDKKRAYEHLIVKGFFEKPLTMHQLKLLLA